MSICRAPVRFLWTALAVKNSNGSVSVHRILRAIRVDSPLTSVDFTLDGTGLVVGSTQGKIYQYDLRNSSAPTKITAAHRTSVTCLRFQSNTNRQKVAARANRVLLNSL